MDPLLLVSVPALLGVGRADDSVSVIYEVGARAVSVRRELVEGEKGERAGGEGGL